MNGRRAGRVVGAVADSIRAELPFASVGEGVTIETSGGRRLPAIVTKVERGIVTISAHAPLDGVGIGDPVLSDARATMLPLGTALLGRAIDAAGSAMDSGPLVHGRLAEVLPIPLAAAKRAPVERPFWTGIRAIDALVTIGRGARVGIFGGPGVGKSVLIEMLERGAVADAVVIGLVGERGREAAAWMKKLERHATIVCAPQDRAPAERVRAAHVAMAQGSELRRRGLNVLVILDSLARFATAARELAIANGESVGRGGYPPSVWSEMARLLERAGNYAGGSATLLATVLSDGPDEREPLSDMARASLDGHIILSATLARAGHYPAIDVVASTSRTMNDVVGPKHRAAAELVRRALAELERTRELRELSFSPSDPFLDRAVATAADIEAFLCQREIGGNPEQTLRRLGELALALRPVAVGVAS